MAFLFPDPGPKLRLAKPPLKEVICQLRFPPILRISEESPVLFQERIRGRLSQFLVQRSFSGLAQAVVETGNLEAGPRTYRFQTIPGDEFAALSVDFVAVSSSRYLRWSAYADLLQFVIDAFAAVYEPDDGSRLGLRYRNLITPALVGASSLEETKALLNEPLRAALLSSVLDDPVETLCEVRARVGGDDVSREFLTLRSGLAVSPDAEAGFLLDLDYYAEGRIPWTGLAERCARYHDRIYSAFRWCLARDGLDAFGPQEATQ